MMEGSDNAGETASQHQQSLYHNGAAAAPTTATHHRHGRPVVVVPPPGISSTTTTTTATSHQQQQSQGSEPPLTPEQRAAEINRAIQYWLDKSTIHIVPRWTVFVVLLALFFLRVYVVQGYFIVAYGLGIFLLNNFIAFLSPLEDPSTSNSNDDGLSLPVSAKDGKEFRPFTRRLPEFKFWLSSTRGVLTSITMTLFSVFDIPVFWPILLIYFFVLFFMTMKRQIIHMYQHKYVPISWGKVKSKNAGVERGMFGGGMRRDR